MEGVWSQPSKEWILEKMTSLPLHTCNPGVALCLVNLCVCTLTLCFLINSCLQKFRRRVFSHFGWDEKHVFIPSVNQGLSGSIYYTTNFKIAWYAQYLFFFQEVSPHYTDWCQPCSMSSCYVAERGEDWDAKDFLIRLLGGWNKITE